MVPLLLCLLVRVLDIEDPGSKRYHFFFPIDPKLWMIPPFFLLPARPPQWGFCRQDVAEESASSVIGFLPQRPFCQVCLITGLQYISHPWRDAFVFSVFAPNTMDKKVGNKHHETERCCYGWLPVLMRTPGTLLSSRDVLVFPYTVVFWKGLGSTYMSYFEKLKCYGRAFVTQKQLRRNMLVLSNFFGESGGFVQSEPLK